MFRIEFGPDIVLLLKLLTSGAFASTVGLAVDPELHMQPLLHKCNVGLDGGSPQMHKGFLISGCASVRRGP